MFDIIRGFIADPIGMLISVLCILIALPFHEYAHAWVAYKMGDNTAYMQGRLTLDPIKHLDMWGFISMLVFGFGWAKPVPINPNQFKNKRMGTILVSLAGITMNFLLAFLSMLILVAISVFWGNYANEYLMFGLLSFIWINLSLMVFNLLPIPPLDGYQAIKEFLLGHLNLNWLWQYERFGIIILLILSLVGVTSMIIRPITGVIYDFMYSVAILIFGAF